MIPSALVARAAAAGQPVSAHLELTWSCNWRCRICFISRHADKRRLSATEWIGVLEDLRRIGTLHVTLTGGEPSMHPEFLAIARAVAKLRFVLSIFTNGSRVDDALADEIASLHPLAVEISIHGATAATHDAMTRRRGSFDRAIEATRRLTIRGTRVKLKTVVTSRNETELAAMRELAYSVGAEFQFDLTLSPRDDGELSPLDSTASRPGITKALRFADAAGALKRVTRHRGSPNCGLGLTTLAIDPEGNVFPCAEWRVPMGNVRERAISGFWSESEVRRAAAEASVRANNAIAACGISAGTLTFCPARALQRTGDAMIPDPEFVERTAIATALLNGVD